MSPFPHRFTHHAGEDGIWIERQHKLWPVEASEANRAATEPHIVRWAFAASIETDLVTPGSPCGDSRPTAGDDTITLPPEIGYTGALTHVEKGLFEVGSEPRADGDKISPEGVLIHDQGPSAPVGPWVEQGTRAMHPSTDFPARPSPAGRPRQECR